MWIRKLQLTNFKAFANCEITLLPGINLLIGINGSGKTSVLDACCVALGGYFNKEPVAQNKRPIKLSEIRMNEGRNTAEKSTIASTAFVGENEIAWSRTLNSKTKSHDIKNADPIGKVGHANIGNFENTDDRTIVPLIAYYSTQRLFSKANESKIQKYDAGNGRRNGYLLCLSELGIPHILEEWIGNAATRKALKISDGITIRDEGAVSLVLAALICAPGMGVYFRVQVLNTLGSGSVSRWQGCPP